MTRAVRSPGSTLKPFIYGLAFEDGFVHPESLIDDRPIRFGSYAPENFDMTFQGTVPVRKRAAAVAERAGDRAARPRRLQPAVVAAASRPAPRWCCRRTKRRALRWASAASASRLQDLAQLYAGLRAAWHHQAAARDHGRDDDEREPTRLMDQVAAWQVGNVLIGTPPPENGVRRPHRLQDRHQLRLSRRLVGRLRRPHHHRRLGRPARRRAGAGPDRARRARRRSCSTPSPAPANMPAPLPKAPKGALVAGNAKLPLPLRRFRAVGELVRTGSDHAPHIQFPLNGSRIDVDRAGDGRLAPMPVKVAGGVAADDGSGERRSVGEIDSRRQRLFDPPRAGLCAADRDRCNGRGGHSCDQNSIAGHAKRLSAMAVSAYAEPMVETYARPRFGEPREPKNRANPGSRLVRVIDFVTGSPRARRRVPAALRPAVLPAGLLQHPAGRSRRGALRAGDQADGRERRFRRHPLPG